MTDRIPEIAQILLGIDAHASIRTYIMMPTKEDAASARKIVLMTIRNPAYSSLKAGERLAFIESRLRICLTGNKTVSGWVVQVLGMRDGLARLAGYLKQAFNAKAATATP